MRILNLKEKKTLDLLSIFLTKNEAIQLIEYLEDLIQNPSHQHSHLSSDDYKKEITVWLYDNENFDKLPPNVKELIHDDKWE